MNAYGEAAELFLADLSFSYKNIRVKSSTSTDVTQLKSEQTSKNGNFPN